MSGRTGSCVCVCVEVCADVQGAACVQCVCEYMWRTAQRDASVCVCTRAHVKRHIVCVCVCGKAYANAREACAHGYVYMFVYMGKYIKMLLSVCLCVCLCVCVPVCVRVCVCPCVCVCVCPVCVCV